LSMCLNQWRYGPQGMRPKFYCMNVFVCSSYVINFEGLYMDPIEVRVHDETNQQTQGKLVGMS
jgi:hypothetical protein